MVGIVIVSHSRQLAQGVRELAAQMTQGRVAIAIAAGIDDPGQPLGTDAVQVQQAIESVYGEAGVVVLMDLGSAVMSAELALEFLPPPQRAQVYLCEAPLVEGAIAAAVAASTGSSVERVLAEARAALSAKASQINNQIHDQITSQVNSAPDLPLLDRAKTLDLTIHNRLGLHARPAAQFVATATRFDADLQVQNLTRDTPAVRADSINQVMTLAIRQGDQIRVTARGREVDSALAALQALVEANFGEADAEPIPRSHSAPVAASLPAADLNGIPVSAGVAIAPIALYRPINMVDTFELADELMDATTEWQRLQAALQTAQQELQALRSRMASQIGEAEAAIFEAQQQFLADAVLLETVEQYIGQQQMSAEIAWQTAIAELSDTYRHLDDAYLQARSSDIADVGQRVLRQLTGEETISLRLQQPAILVATDLTPSDTVQLDPNQILGICTALGSATSHSAILARALGIPAVVGVGAGLLDLKEGLRLAIEGDTGRIWIEPAPELIERLQTQQQTWQAAQQQLQQQADCPAVTRDGRSIPVFANIATVSEARLALDWGAAGVGLLRTEFLYLDRTTAPSEAEQIAAYQTIAQTLDSRPLVLRTLDVGGDKPLPYLKQPPEPNPFLGQRGIRFCLQQRQLFKTQLRAILQVSAHHPLKLLLPMVTTLAELRAAKAIVAEAQAELQQAGLAFDRSLPIGIMVEVPAAVAIADQLAAEVDFFSIGTNDLSQYVMAADRTNPQVASLTDALHPAVLRMVQQTVAAAQRASISVGVCGELAADPIAIPLLLGLGIDQLSLMPRAIPAAKQTIASWTIPAAQPLAAIALQQESAAAVRAILASEQQNPD